MTQCVRRYQGSDGLYRRCRRRAVVKFTPEWPSPDAPQAVLCERHDRPAPFGYIRAALGSER